MAKQKIWSTEEIKSFIGEYHDRHELWDFTCPNYRNRKLKRRVREWLASKYNSTEVEVKQKIQTLRSSFCSEIRHLVILPDGRKMNESRWPYFELLKFLKTPEQCRDSCHNALIDFPEVKPKKKAGRRKQRSKLEEDSTEDTEVAEDDSDFEVKSRKRVKTKQWSVEETERLLVVIRGQHDLWYQACPNYRDKDWKCTLRQQIGKQFATTGEEIERKFRALRHSFRDYQRLDNGHNEALQKWRHSQAMMFLDSIPDECSEHCFAKPKPQFKPDTDESECSQQPMFTVHFEESNEEIRPNSIGQINHNNNNKSPYSVPVNPYQAFGDYVASELHNLSPDKAKRLKAKILQVIISSAD